MKSHKKYIKYAIISVVLCTVIGVNASPKLIYNYTQSIPIGWYWIKTSPNLAVNDVIAFETPDHVKDLVSERQWLPNNGYLMKSIAAIHGDQVCFKGAKIFINGEYKTHRQSHDSLGRILPTIELCRTLKTNEFFVAETSLSNSFDSRYFGPIQSSKIIGKALKIDPQKALSRAYLPI